MSMNTSGKSGFSLIEMVMAVGLFAIVIGSAYTALMQAMILSKNARMESDATLYITNEMEFLRSLDWTDIDELDDKATFHTTSPDINIIGKYAKSVRKNDQVLIKLRTDWLDANERNQSTEVICILSKNGLGSL